MGPQPLSRVRPNATTYFSPDVLFTYPDLAAYAMSVIGQWARTDATLSELLSVMLTTSDLAVGMAMYQALTGTGSRQTALLAAAEEALPVQDFWLLQAVLRLNRPSRDQRNDFAHHLWGTSDDVPNALLLVDPAVFIKHLTIRDIYAKNAMAMFLRYSSMGKEVPTGELDHSKVQVYRKRALQQAAKDAIKAGARAFYLSVAIDHDRFGQHSDAMRRQLLSEPAIQQAFEALSRENMKSPPPPPRPKKPSSKQRRTQALSRKKKV